MRKKYNTFIILCVAVLTVVLLSGCNHGSVKDQHNAVENYESLDDTGNETKKQYESVEAQEAEDVSIEGEDKQIFGRLLWDIYDTGSYLDGRQLDYSGTQAAAENSFAVLDIDHDGRDELLLLWSNACMAGMVEIVFGYDGEKIYEELSEFPAMSFYENGSVKADWSHSQGLSGRIWPFNIYSYHRESDTYQFVGSVEAWDLGEENNTGNEFPKNIDADGDGLVYYIASSEDGVGKYEDRIWVDGAEYEEWQNAYLDDSEEISILWQKLTEENIAALGCPKPDVERPEPLG